MPYYAPWNDPNPYKVWFDPYWCLVTRQGKLAVMKYVGYSPGGLTWASMRPQIYQTWGRMRRFAIQGGLDMVFWNEHGRWETIPRNLSANEFYWRYYREDIIPSWNGEY